MADDATRNPSIDYAEHRALSSTRGVSVYGTDGSAYYGWNIDSNGAGLVRGTFTANIASALTVTAYIAGSATLFAVVNTGGGGAQTVTAFIAQSVTLNAVVNTPSPQVTVNVASGATVAAVVAGTATIFVAGSVTVNALVNTLTTVNVAAGATIAGVISGTVTAWDANRVTTLFEPRTLFVPPTPTQLSNLPSKYGIAVAASASNTSPLYYGFTSTVTSGIGFANSGGELWRRASSVSLEIDNANRVYLVSAPGVTMIATYVAV